MQINRFRPIKIKSNSYILIVRNQYDNVYDSTTCPVLELLTLAIRVINLKYYMQIYNTTVI